MSKKWTGNRTRDRLLRRLIKSEVEGTLPGPSPSPSASDQPFAGLLNSGILVPPGTAGPAAVDSTLHSMWLESPREILIRWFNRQTPERRAAMVSPEDAFERAAKRAAVVLKATQLGASTPTTAPRGWGARWNPKAQIERMTTTLERWDNAVMVVSSIADPDAMARAERNAGDAASLIAVDRSVVESWVAYLKTVSSPYEFDAATVEALTLAHELYAASCQRLGNEALPWVEQLGCAEFQRVLLGLPFSPLVLSLLPGSVAAAQRGNS